MNNQPRLPLFHDAQDLRVLCRCAVCGGEIYEDGVFFQAYPLRVCWFCLQRAHAGFCRGTAVEVLQ